MAEYVTEWGESVDDFTVREEVVRCRDCKHSGAKGCICYYFMTIDTWENPVPSNVDPDGFCAWASRKESE